MTISYGIMNFLMSEFRGLIDQAFISVSVVSLIISFFSFFFFYSTRGFFGEKNTVRDIFICFWSFFSDDNDDEDSIQVLGELEKIDDDCDKHGIQFVKIDDDKAAKAFGIDELPSIVYFEKQIPSLYDGELASEDLQDAEFIASRIPHFKPSKTTPNYRGSPNVR